MKKANKKKKILIIEDEPTEMKALAYKFVQAGFNVIKAKNGEQGLSLALKEHPNLILLDILIPKIDGLEMLKKLRKQKDYRDISVIVLSNLSESYRVAEALENGVNYFIVKANSTLEEVVRIAKKELDRGEIIIK